MDTNTKQVEIDKKIDELIAVEEGYSPTLPSPEEQEEYLLKYSFSALVFSFFYFWRMGDKIFFWLSIATAFLFSPLLFIFPLFARRRAWTYGNWRSFNHFVSVQKKWDQAAGYGAIISAVIVILLINWEVRLLNNFVNTAGVKNINDLQQIQDELQSTLGN